MFDIAFSNLLDPMSALAVLIWLVNIGLSIGLAAVLLWAYERGKPKDA